MEEPIALIERLKSVHRKIAHAAMRSGREPSDVALIAVTKTVPLEVVMRAVEAGVRDFGENRVQEASAKIPACSGRFPGSRIVWHLIGHLQRNKARAAVKLFDLIQTVDSAALAADLDRHALSEGKVQRVLIQVKLGGEDTKHGIEESLLLPLLRELRCFGSLSVEGLMTIPPFSEDPEKTRQWFRRLRELRDEAAAEGFRLPQLSMGMSHDFEAAIEEGATMVRVGTAIFGERG